MDYTKLHSILCDVWYRDLSADEALNLIDDLTCKGIEGKQVWQPIETAPRDTKTMFVVKAFDVKPSPKYTGLYTTDPYCVWVEDGEFVRWPHLFPPTHWMPLPPKPEG